MKERESPEPLIGSFNLLARTSPTNCFFFSSFFFHSCVVNANGIDVFEFNADGSIAALYSWSHNEQEEEKNKTKTPRIFFCVFLRHQQRET